MDLLSNRRKVRLYHEPFWRKGWFLWTFWGGLLLGATAAIGAFLYLKPFKEKADAFDLSRIDDVAVASVIYDREGIEIGRIYEEENRELVSLHDLPNSLIQALIAAEDSRFFHHKGVDYAGIGRAVWINLKAGTTTQGASTITQQLARNAFELREYSINRKLTEAFLAYRIEQNFTKTQILELYLNRIFFGPGAYGIRSASRRYFGKHPRELTTEECATLCGLIKSPVRLSPLRNPEESLKARNNVLDRMQVEGMLTLDECERLKAKPLVTNPDPLVTRHPFVYEEIRARLMEELPLEQMAKGGFHIYTTLDARMQRLAETSLRRQLDAVEALPEYNGQTYAAFQKAARTAAAKGTAAPKPDYLQGAVLLMENRTGGILAMVGGRDYGNSKFNIALSARRAAGTGFLPFVYATAFANGIYPGTRIADEPLDANRVMIGGLVGILGEWGVESAINVHLGPIPARRALTLSKLGAAFRIGEKVGLEKIVALARAAGIVIPANRERVPATMLGQTETTLGEYCLAYSSFPNQGRRAAELRLIRRVVDHEGREVLRVDDTADHLVPAIDPVAAYQTWGALRETLTHGTAARSRTELGLTKGDFGGQTSTAYNFTDNWFIGSSDKLTCGTWCGFDRPKPIFPGAFSSQTVLPVWVEVMNAAAEIWQPMTVPPPPDTRRHEICRVSGLPAGDYCYEREPSPDGSGPRLLRSTYFEHVRPGTRVEGVCDAHQAGSDQLLDLLRPLDASESGSPSAADSILPKVPILTGSDPYRAVFAASAPDSATLANSGPAVMKPKVVGENPENPDQNPVPADTGPAAPPLPRPGRISLDDF